MADADDRDEFDSMGEVWVEQRLILRRLADGEATLLFPEDQAAQGDTDSSDTARLAALQLIAAGDIALIDGTSEHYVITEKGRAHLAKMNQFEATMAGALQQVLNANALLPKLDFSKLAPALPDLSGVFTAAMEANGRSLASQVASSFSPSALGLSTAFTGKLLTALDDSISKLLAGLPTYLSQLHGWGAVGRHRHGVPEFLQSTGIPLLGSTPPTLCTQLLELPAGEREVLAEQVLARHRGAVLRQCRDVVSRERDTEHPDWYALAARAQDALEAGASEAAQALATVVLDRVVVELVESLIDTEAFLDRGDMEPGKYKKLVKGLVLYEKPQGKAGEMFTGPHERYNALDRLIWQLTIPVLLSAYQTQRQEPEPVNYSRHVTVHSASQAHFTDINALRAVMTTTSLLWLLDPTTAVEIGGALL